MAVVLLAVEVEQPRCLRAAAQNQDPAAEKVGVEGSDEDFADQQDQRELQDDAGATVTTKPSRLLTPEESEVLVAIKVAREAGRSGCSKVYDAVVVPIEGGDMDVTAFFT